jgi:hypothetical protein
MINCKLLLTAIALLFCGVLTTACTSSTPEQVLSTHGDSVRNMIAEQTYTPDDEVATLDGDKSNNVLRTYREDVPTTDKVGQDIIQITLD